MTVNEMIAAGQSGVLSVAFLYFIYKLPNMLREHAKAKKEQQKADSDEKDRERIFQSEEREKERMFQAEERKLDREARHETSDNFNKTVTQIVVAHKESTDRLAAALSDVKIATERICRFTGGR